MNYKVTEFAPQHKGRFYDSISDFHPPVPADRYEQEVREGYARRTPEILKYAAKGGQIGVNFMHFQYTHNAEQALFTRYAEGLPLYPQYPFLHMFLTLACPWRKLAILVEEEDAEWSEQTIQDENELLTLHGWRVFRLPHHVARTFAEDVLPDHISYGLENGWQYDGEKEEWERLEPQLAYSTIDGFFKWLKKEHFSREALVRYQLAARQQITDQLVTAPTPSPEEEMKSMLNDFLTEEEKVTERFKKWAELEGYNTEAFPNGQYMHHITDSAWKVWQAALTAQKATLGQETSAPEPGPTE